MAGPPSPDVSGSSQQCSARLCLAQDTTTRIWDMRKLDRSVHTFCGEMSAVRSLRYSPDGRFLAVAEAADFVNLYDVASGYTRQALRLVPQALLQGFRALSSVFQLSSYSGSQHSILAAI